MLASASLLVVAAVGSHGDDTYPVSAVLDFARSACAELGVAGEGYDSEWRDYDLEDDWRDPSVFSDQEWTEWQDDGRLKVLVTTIIDRELRLIWYKERPSASRASCTVYDLDAPLLDWVSAGDEWAGRMGQEVVFATTRLYNERAAIHERDYRSGVVHRQWYPGLTEGSITTILTYTTREYSSVYGKPQGLAYSELMSDPLTVGEGSSTTDLGESH